jgi:UDP-N-acetylglucosamine 2-epimerase (non-hydrolysing)
MSERDIVIVAGARPNFVKVAPMLRVLRTRSCARVALVHTGQHYDFEMSGVFFEQLGIPEPDAHLQVGSGSHGKQTAAIMSAFEGYLDSRAAPTDVVVVGDVNSTMACALVAAKRGTPVTHVEAGLRSFDRTMPEEINRVVTDAVASLLLVSEPAGLENLQREGVEASKIKYVGNVMIDTLVEQLPAARALEMASRLSLGTDYAVVTLHRPANVDDPARLRELVTFLQRLASETRVVFPVHPRTEARLAALGLRSELDGARITITPPLGYREFLGLIQGARVVVSDSGGVQEETTYLGVPCVTMRANTERPVTVSLGTNVLVGSDFAGAWQAASIAIHRAPAPARAVEGWDGRAAERIIDAICARN